MKKIVFTATMLLVTISSIAQNEIVSTANLDSNNLVTGIRVGLALPSFVLHDKWSFEDESESYTETVKNPLGISVGYVHLPTQEIGYTANLGYMNFEQYKQQATLLRIDANAGYAFTKLINLKGGLNLSKFTNGDIIKELSPAFGFQISMGFQLNKIFGLDVGYTSLKQSGSIEGIKVESSASGAELNLNGTF